jgi:hydrogenase/urease accessory protein HupE
MEISTLLQPVSIAIEVILVVLGLGIAVQKKRCYGWFIAITFGIYVVYDTMHFTGVQVSQNILSGIFFIATLSILIGIWQLYKELNSP